MTSNGNIGLIGLAVMGQNLVLNLVDHGYKVIVYNRSEEKTKEFIENNSSNMIKPVYSLQDMVSNLTRPRKIIMMVKAGAPVDGIIQQLIPLLDNGDIIIDGGNSNFKDTIRRTTEIESHNLLFVGMGVSGGEEGARFGPSIMPGGSELAWNHIKEIFQAIAAKVDNNQSCCEWVGENGAGHYVKMIHNGIEYGDMQLIAEAYDIMRHALKMSSSEISEVFKRWNSGKLDSYLIEITAEILSKKDKNGEPIIDSIIDRAGQKGTGMWTVMSSLELGVPVNLIAESVYARIVSSFKSDRVNASQKIQPKLADLSLLDRNEVIEMIEAALYASKIISYSQGFNLMKIAATEYSWNLNFGNIALLWRGGCIIRSVFLGKIKTAFDIDPYLQNLVLDEFFKNEIASNETAWRELVSLMVKVGIPVPGFSSALAYYDSFRRDLLPANLIQAQRDYFGAHGYEKIGEVAGELFHTDWVNLN